jgi:hypothetical protein
MIYDCRQNVVTALNLFYGFTAEEGGPSSPWNIGNTAYFHTGGSTEKQDHYQH